MIVCEKCRSNDVCSLPSKGKATECFFISLTEEQLAMQTKEYKLGYEKAVDDFVEKYKHCDNRGIQCKKALNCADCIAEQLKASLE